jgi:hypothetical protein
LPIGDNDRTIVPAGALAAETLTLKQKLKAEG